MTKLNFKVLKTKWKARLWEIELNGVKLSTPVFMPVGTNGTVKWLVPEMLTNSEYLGTKDPVKLILWNTFHLYLRPGEKIIEKSGGLHKFENWPGLILTDSWWFQVFSLGIGSRTKKNDNLVKIEDNWVYFKSPRDGSKHFFSPEGVVDIQQSLWSDIMMMLDVCSPVDNISKDEVVRQMEITHKWAKTAYEYFLPKYESSRGVLFPIIQWWLYKDLREQSASFLSDFCMDWIAIWWLSVWESKDEMYSIVDFLSDKLPADKPRYLMWIGTPEDIRQAIYHGIDMFDCVLPTRLGRHGTAFSINWYVKLKNSTCREDFSALSSDCNCYVCKNYTKAYLHHLVRENEMLWAILISLHNIAYLHQLVEKIKMEISE